MMADDEKDRLKKLEQFFKEVKELTINHNTIENNDCVAVVYPDDLGKALEKVDPKWWENNG